MNVLLFVRPVSWIKTSVYGLLLAGVYYSSILNLVNKDWQNEDNSYCFLIPLIALYLIWEKKAELLKLLSVPSWKGLVIFFPSVALFFVGDLAGEFYSVYFSFWMLLVSICWMHLGWRKIREISFALVFMLAMFPLPDFVNSRITLYLKLISSQIGVDLMRLMGMSAYREGNVIDLGFTQLQVVDACSGLRYFFPLIILGILLAYFFRASWWKKAVVVISTIPISIIVNSLRIASVGILYPIWGPAVAEGFFHDFSGWFIFMLSLGILLLEMGILRRVPSFRLKVEGGDKTEVKSSKLKVQEYESIQNSKFKIQNFFSPPQFIVAVIL